MRLKASSGPEVVAAIVKQAVDLQVEVDKLKSDPGEVEQSCEVVDQSGGRKDGFASAENAFGFRLSHWLLDQD
ncbi:hypothetical protein B296_00026657 [Ensete ventricosum]|uniref:Uncharacterized protein n=1 Tax=Ensete ventricosum TaxID=4639 RepID=A0A426ZUA1_ENSVE|nr:hypothetical protein B296_00026657 [Ensete ventricosum]